MYRLSVWNTLDGIACLNLIGELSIAYNIGRKNYVYDSVDSMFNENPFSESITYIKSYGRNIEFYNHKECIILVILKPSIFNPAVTSNFYYVKKFSATNTSRVKQAYHTLQIAKWAIDRGTYEDRISVI
jgi:hypothetical protein